jgi:hypothetical protein
MLSLSAEVTSWRIFRLSLLLLSLWLPRLKAKDQIVVKAPELLRCAYISCVVTILRSENRVTLLQMS